MRAEAGERSVTRLRRELRRDLEAIPGAEVDYAEIVEESTLGPLRFVTPSLKARLLVAVRLGTVRLIDNVPVKLLR